MEVQVGGVGDVVTQRLDELDQLELTAEEVTRAAAFVGPIEADNLARDSARPSGP